jgi:hypothetical protein
VIESGPEIYPPMDFAITKRTFNDSTDRVLWRAKQGMYINNIYYARYID